MRQIPATSPDVEAHLIGVLNTLTAPVTWHNVLPATSGAHQFGVVRADLQGRVTPISRYCRVGLQGRVVAQGRADIGAAFDLVSAACTHLESLSGQGIILNAETQSGPLRVTDEVTRLEFSFATVLLEVAV